MPELEGLNSQVLAISCDPIASKQAWGKSLGGISYPLVSDFWPHGEVAQKYRVFNFEFGRSERATFIVAKSGAIGWVKLYEPGVQPDNAEMIEALRRLEGSALG